MSDRGSRYFYRAPSTDTELDVRSASIEAIPFAPPPPVPSRRPPGATTGSRYEVIDEIHRGGMGEILLARLITPGGFSRQVVLKGLLARLSSDNVSHALFMREAHLMSQLEHPNIVRVFDLPEIDGRTYLAMEYVRGRNLHQVIQRRGARGSGVPPLIALTAVAQSLRGLHYAHCLRSDKGEHLGVVHRDVSPGNILMSFLGEIKVTDFGIAKLADSPKYTGPRSIRGKARYVAPEQVHGRPATITSDIYSAGVVLAEALMGAPLWERGTIPDTLMAIVTQDRAEIIDRILRDIPSMLGLRRILRNTLSTAPDQRPQSALHFAEILEAIVRAHGAPPTPVDLGEFLRNLFRGDDDVPRHDGFGRTGLPTPELKRDRLDEEDTVTNVDDTRPPPLPFDAPAFEPPPSVPVVPPMVPADATPTPLTTTTGFRTAGIPAGAAVFEDPADPAQQFSPPPSAPPPRSKTDKGSTVFTLMVGITIGALLAIVGCLLALTLGTGA